MIDQNGVFSDGKIRDQSFPITILRDVRHARIKNLFSGVVGDGSTIKYDFADLDASEPSNDLGKFALSVSVDARNAKNFASRNFEVNPIKSNPATVT